MCGRFVNVAGGRELVETFEAEEVIGAELAPSWNIAPTDPVRVIVERRPRHGGASDAVRQVRTALWGLVPSWSPTRDGGSPMINARIETVTERPAFKAAAARRRCLVPALGYYEWQKTDSGKIPHFLRRRGGGLLAMAGLYELWRDPAVSDDDSERWLWTCAIITQQATDLLGEIHDRNPVVVPPGLRDAWLDCSADRLGVAADLLDQVPPARLEPQVVSPAVGSVRNNGPELIEPAASDPPSQQRLELADERVVNRQRPAPRSPWR
jgi:putative SOS response-associated peptidase YedK